MPTAGMQASGGALPPRDDRRVVSKRVIGDAVMAVDALVVFVAAVVAKWFYIGAVLQSDQDVIPYAAVGAVGAIVAALAFHFQGLYVFETLARPRGQTRRVLAGLVLAALAVVTAGYLLKIGEDYSRGWFISWISLSALTLVVFHPTLGRILRRLTAEGLFARRVLVYGSGAIAARLTEKAAGDGSQMRICGAFDDPANGVEARVAVAGGLAELIAYARENPVDEVLIALPLDEVERISQLVEALSVLPVDIRLCPSAAEIRQSPKALLNYQGLTVVELESRPLDDWGPILKVIEDRMLSFLALVFFAPFMLLIALAIRLDSKGPIFFRQRRHGFNNTIFHVYKFRTMHVAEDGPDIVQARRDDPRVTRAGRFLRRTSLDELPQLINVLRGEMSLVGPRPHAISHNEHYSTLLERYANRHKVKPGMTGWAQVKGFRGETDTPEKMKGRVDCDLYYIENWSLWFDLKILLMTPFFGFIGKNVR
ncbi:undecaprenyl-phosphate glucose phosphotransferase [Parvibaculum sp.]|uniref:undecaprenyl-phosphate glucose phosphotransferase n=1 Tax=Parvibaculum sp. TaxID=2024848 RepID=UPI001E05B767|nr:undecaprenyl-phosphate glucose phosphotransferase [Parvibaculum sp.]MBX3489200.1 undecaprenyl-phosphate glucose phosphotransferase [Parvibaculum sp.]